MNQKEYEKRLLEEPLFKSIAFKSKGNGKIELVDEFDSFSHQVHPITSLPDNLIKALALRLNKNEKNIFYHILSSKECSEKTIKNKTLNDFVKESIQKFVHSLGNEKKQIEQDKENLEHSYIQSFYGPPFNIMIKLIVDSRIIPCREEDIDFDINEFIAVNDNTLALESYCEEDKKMKKSLGCSYRFIVSGTKEDLFYSFDSYNSTNKKELSKIKDMLIHPIGNERSTVFWQYVDHFLLYEVKLAPYDRLGEIKGKLVSRDTLKNKNHIVYIARNENNEVKYIGEGQPNRYEHVNSGTSHVYELNKEHFLGRKMDVEVYNENLTKSEALAIERFLLNKYKHCGLWNKKDYEK